MNGIPEFEQLFLGFQISVKMWLINFEHYVPILKSLQMYHHVYHHIIFFIGTIATALLNIQETLELYFYPF